jgi:hypothetical protein
MKNITLLVLMTLVLSIGMMSATSLKIANSAGVVKINLSDTGSIDTPGNITTTAYYVGNGQFLTGITVASGAVTIWGENITAGTIAFARLPTLTSTHTHAYQNITGTPTCTANQFVIMNATGWFCGTATIGANSTTIAGENITGGTIAFARLPTLTDTHTLAYQNITGEPVCTTGQVVTMNATGWFCIASGSMSYTNIGLTNITNTWALDQIYTNDINVTSDVNLLSATASIRRGTTNITIDNTNNVIITLGA